MKPSQRKTIENRATEKAIDKVTLLFLLALHDEYGFGEKRLARVLETVDRYAGHIDKHLVGLNDVKKMVEKSTGLKGW